MTHELDADLQTITLSTADQDLILTREDFATALTVFRFAALIEQREIAECARVIREGSGRLSAFDIP